MKKVITYGSFDLFHQGHYNLLKRAKALGDYLIVGITTEQYDTSRGKLNVVDSLITRIDNVRATGFVDEIVIEDHKGQKIEDIRKYGVDVFTVGSDWKGQFDYLKEFCEVVYLPRTKDISSTQKRIDRSPIIKVGVVGTGRVAKRFPTECRSVSGITICAVYNPHGDHAREFAEKFELPDWFDDYDKFLEDVDAVYVASPHQTHYEYTKRALEKNKHVLCEKPFVLKKAEAQELFALAKERGVVLMEAIKTAYCPGFNQLVSVAKSGVIGDIVDVEAAFTRLTEPGTRELIDTKWGGSFTEFGSYTMLAIVKLLGRDYKEARFDIIPAENGIDSYAKVSFVYDNGLAMSKTGVSVKSEGQLVVAGTKGYILAESPWWLTKSFQVRYEDPGIIDTYSADYLGKGTRYEIAEFVRAIGGDETYSYKLTRNDSICIAGVMEEFLKQTRTSAN